MSRENLQKYGLILALIIAGITLPTSIIALTRETRTTNYYENYYGNNETGTDYSKPLERVDYYNFDRYDCIVRNFTLSSNFAYWFYWNVSSSFRFVFWVISGYFYDCIVDLNGTLEGYQLIDAVDIYERSSTIGTYSSYFIPPYLNEWLFIYIVDEIITVNITITDEILKI
jgi:hypothetical protein